MQTVCKLTERKTHQRLEQRVGGWLLSAGAMVCVAGCGTSGQLQAVQGAEPNSSWVALQGGRVAPVSAGVEVEMPAAPFRARYTDAGGVYYKASVPLLYRTSWGSVVALEGGLYLQNGRPGRGRLWTEPVLITPTMPFATDFAVELHRP